MLRAALHVCAGSVYRCGLMRPGRRRFGRLLAAVCLVVGGCAAGSRSGAPDGLDARTDPHLSARQNLQRLAEAEANAPPKLHGDRAPIEVPPGVQAQLLARPREPEPRARLSLHDALSEIVSHVGPAEAAPTEDAPPDASARDQALRHYAKGRDAALRNRHFLAITELENAQALDPDHPAILRQLARSYLAMGNAVKAANVFERLLRMEPGDSEARFTLGLVSANRRRFELAVATLGWPRLHGTSFDHDPAAGFLADFYLVSALRQLGYDRGTTELGRALVVSLPARLEEPTAYSDRLESVYRQRREIWRDVGDAHCRLGEYEQALDAYNQSASVAWDPTALPPRVVYANLCLGRVFGAQYAVLGALDDSSSDAAALGGQGIALCSYLVDQLDGVALLAEAVTQRYQARPDDPNLARAAAVLLPRDGAVRLLREFLDRLPDPDQSGEVVSQLLGWLAQRDVGSAVQLTAALVSDHPGSAGDYVDRLAVAVPRSSKAINAADDIALPAHVQIRSRLLARLGAVGEAWQACVQGLTNSPGDRSLNLLQIELAALLQEPALLDDAVATAEGLGDVASWLLRARARRAVGQSDLAVRAAAAAVDLAPGDPEALIELARAHAAYAATLSDSADRRQHAINAVIAAQQAVELDPQLDEAFEVLLSVYGPGGLLSDSTLLERTLDELRRQNPSGRLYQRLRAGDAFRQRRYRQALGRLLTLCDSDPDDRESLNLAVTAWIQLDRLDEAEEWLEQRLTHRPGDPLLLEQWVSLQLRRDRVEVATQRVMQVIEADPVNASAGRLLEALHRRGGRPEQAVQLAEQRLRSRPQGIRRELELAALFVGAERDDKAEQRLRWILDRADTAVLSHLVTALGIAGRLSDANAARDPLALEFAETIVQRFPDAPLQVYGVGLRSLARMDRLDERFDALVDRAVRHARGASGSSIQAADIWRQLAQALVDADEPVAAARALRARLWADAPLDAPAISLLATAAVLADAAADQPEASIELIRSLALQDRLSAIIGEESDPTMPEVLFQASTIYSLLGNESGAHRLLGETIHLDPDHPIALNNLGYSRLELGDADAAPLIERAFELAPDDGNVLDTIGWLRYKQGEFRDDGDTPGALSLIRQARDQASEPSPEVLDHLGDTLWRLGDADGATKAWGEAVEMLEDPERHDQLLQNYLLIQTRQWGLLVADPNEMYDRQFGVVLKRARDKLHDVEQGDDPAVAATFDELAADESTGEVKHGRP